MEEMKRMKKNSIEIISKLIFYPVKSDNEEGNVKVSEDESTCTTESLQRTPRPTGGYTRKCSLCQLQVKIAQTCHCYSQGQHSLIDGFSIDKASYRQIEDKEISAESTLYSVLDQRMESINEEGNREESIDLNCDTVETLRQEAPPGMQTADC